VSASSRVLAIAGADLELARLLARRSYPDEACGLMVGRRRRGVAVVTGLEPAPNRAAEPREAFEIAPELALAASRRRERTGEELVGFFHSHPDRDARPSQVDLEKLWVGVSHLILSVRAGTVGTVCSWRIEDGRARREQLVVLPSGGMR
jgi:proteasome lid subunit RPN8/RPN11